MANKAHLNRLRRALYDIDPATLQQTLRECFAQGARVHLAHPFEELDGAEGLYAQAYRPLLEAVPDLERRDFIFMGGESNGAYWVGCAGHYMGVMERAWLDIPPTHKAIAMRYHEFFRIEDGQIVEMQALWDIPQVMMQANAWAFSPSLGVEWLAPSPAPQDGILTTPFEPAHGEASKHLVLEMLNGLARSTESVEAMQLDRYWHPKMNWYGPAGIGTARQVRGFRLWHQIPFLNGMPNRHGIIEAGAFFAEGDYVGFTAFPGMVMNISGDGWLGIAPSNQGITMRSLDFWRCENGMIRENWVLVDLLHVYHQLGVDVFKRMKEYTYARQPHPQEWRS